MTATMRADLRWLTAVTLNTLTAKMLDDIAKGKAASAAHYARLAADTAGHLAALDAVAA